jgi:hypothetical protein
MIDTTSGEIVRHHKAFSGEGETGNGEKVD